MKFCKQKEQEIQEGVPSINSNIQILELNLRATCQTNPLDHEMSTSGNKVLIEQHGVP